MIEGLNSPIGNLYTSVKGKKKKGINYWKIVEAHSLYKKKKNQIPLANQQYMRELNPEGNEDCKLKLIWNPAPLNSTYL